MKYIVCVTLQQIANMIGYICFRDSTEGYIIDNFINSSSDKGSGYVLAVYIVIYMMLIMPTVFINCRENILSFFMGDLQSDNALHSSTSVTLLFLLIGISLVIHSNATHPHGCVGTGVGPTFNLILRVLGNVCAFLMFIPPLLHYSLFRRKNNPYFNGCCALFVCATYFCIAIPFGYNIAE